jgi:hypothetical protein
MTRYLSSVLYVYGLYVILHLFSPKHLAFAYCEPLFAISRYPDDNLFQANFHALRALSSKTGRVYYHTAQISESIQHLIQYKRKSWDREKTRYHTQWRPDIYIVVRKPVLTNPGFGADVLLSATTGFSAPKSWTDAGYDNGPNKWLVCR